MLAAGAEEAAERAGRSRMSERRIDCPEVGMVGSWKITELEVVRPQLLRHPDLPLDNPWKVLVCPSKQMTHSEDGEVREATMNEERMREDGRTSSFVSKRRKRPARYVWRCLVQVAMSHQRAAIVAPGRPLSSSRTLRSGCSRNRIPVSS